MQWQIAGPYVIWVVLALATSILVAVIREPLSRVLREAREQLGASRNRLLARSAARLGRRSYRFWLSRQYEPARTVAGSLDRLAEALPVVGRKSLARVTTLQADLRRQLDTLETVGLRPPDSRVSPMAGNPAGPAPRGSWWKLLLLTLIAGLTGTSNSFLLNEFFQGVLTTDALFPSAFPDFHVSHVFAVLIFMMEVAIGFALHHFAEDREDEGAARRLLALAPWLVLVGLVCLEGWAYALLSYQIDIPERLNLTPDSGLYTFARYFLAVFGAGLTLLLASLGYLLGNEFEKLQAGRETRYQERLLKRYGWAISRGADQVERTERALNRLRAAVQHFHLDLVHQFKREVEAASSSEDLPATIRDAITEALDSARLRRPIRTRAQALADLCIFTAAFVLLVAVSWVSVEYVAGFVRSVHGDRSSANVFALASGVVITGFALAGGYIAREAWSFPWRRFLRVVALCCLAATTSGLITIAVANHTLGPSTGLNVLLGLLHAGLLTILGAGADVAMVNTLHLVRLLGWYLERCVVSAGAALLWMVRAILAAVDWVLRVIAVFGQLVVRPRPPIQFGVAEIPRRPGLSREPQPHARRFADKAYAQAVRGKNA
jgi:hypothetical protein